MAAQSASPVAISAALGEVLDWQHAPMPSLPPHLQYAKLGLAGLAEERHWRELWHQVRVGVRCSAGQGTRLGGGGLCGCRIAPVRPPVREVLMPPSRTVVRALLIDTFDKSERSAGRPDPGNRAASSGARCPRSSAGYRVCRSGDVPQTCPNCCRANPMSSPFEERRANRVIASSSITTSAVANLIHEIERLSNSKT